MSSLLKQYGSLSDLGFNEARIKEINKHAQKATDSTAYGYTSNTKNLWRETKDRTKAGSIEADMRKIGTHLGYEHWGEANSKKIQKYINEATTAQSNASAAKATKAAEASKAAEAAKAAEAKRKQAAALAAKRKEQQNIAAAQKAEAKRQQQAKAAADAKRKKAEDDRKRKAAEAAAAAKREADARKQREAVEAKRQAEIKAKRQAEIEAKRQAAEAKRQAEIEAKRKADEARKNKEDYQRGTERVNDSKIQAPSKDINNSVYDENQQQAQRFSDEYKNHLKEAKDFLGKDNPYSGITNSNYSKDKDEVKPAEFDPSKNEYGSNKYKEAVFSKKDDYGYQMGGYQTPKDGKYGKVDDYNYQMGGYKPMSYKPKGVQPTI